MSLVRRRIVLPLIPTDIFQVIRPTQNKDAVLDLTYQQLLSALSEVFSGGGSLILLQTDGVDNGDQNLLNLVAGSGITLSDDGLGAITITSTGGASFITSVADTASIDLTVTSGVLTADLVDIVAAGTFGDGTNVPQITIDTKGRVTSVALVPITAGAGSVISVATAGLISGGPITVSGTITTSMNTNKLVGRGTAGTGIMEEITVGSGLTLTGAGVLNNTATPTPLGYYGAFSDVTDQFATVISTGYPMLLGVTDLSNGVTVVSNSRVTIANTGIYNIQWSAQFRNPTANEHDVTIWLRKNGVDVPGSAGVVLVPKKHGAFDGHTLPSWNFLLDVIAGDYYEFVWSTEDLNVFISFQPAGSPPPSTASVVLTVTQQSGIMAGTGITAINSLTGAVQTLANGTSGLAPAFSSVGTTHTLNIPSASTASVTAGLISKAEFDTFNGKQDAITLTTTGSNGAATFVSNTLNIPDYNTSATSSAFYGDGFDGIVNLDGTNTYTSFISKVGSAYTLLRNIFPSSFTIAVGVTLNTNGYQITCNGTSTINGSMGSSGNNGGNAVNVFNNYSTAGAGGVSLKPLTTFTDQLLVPFTIAAGNGNSGSTGWGNPGVSIACTWYFYGSLGGGGGAGRNSVGVLVPGSTVTITTGKFLPYSGFNLPLNNYIGFGSTALANSFISVPGGGGGAGAQLGGGWGGAGGGGGGCPFGVKLISNTITISATGLINSNGGNGGNGCGGSLSNWIAGCGGGGGGGGIVYLVTNGLTYTPNNQIKAKGGTGGAGGGPGAGTGAIYTPNPGSNGTDGYIHIYNTFTGTSVFYTGQY